MPYLEKLCVVCGAKYVARNLTRKYCSTKCEYSVRYKRKLYEPKPCPVCGTQFTQRNNTQKYCSEACANSVYRINRYRFDRSIPTATVGAIGELYVSLWLMRNGWDVYRALSPAASCDIAAIKEGRLYRFEVRTGHRNKARLVCYPKKSIRAENIVVVIYPEPELVFIPEEPLPAKMLD